MFDLRLGLALGKSLGEIRSLPYPEIQKWRLMFLLEPWGFHDQEYRTAALLAKLHNSNTSKRRQAKPVKFFMRDMLKGIVDNLRRKTKEEIRPDYDLSTVEGRAAATEASLKAFEAIFGGRMVRKDK